jgi:SAM-dependent methyltransferase
MADEPTVRAPGDHFSDLARAYVAFRPRYPAELYDWLAAGSPAREVAWDCATGNGQAALELAERFGRVEATDVSPSQLAEAEAHPRIRYRQAPGESSGLAPRSVDLVTVAQAAHWLDLPRFFDEVARVGRPGALLAIWGYQLLRSGEEALDAAIQHFFGDTVGPYWPPGRELLDAGYRGFELPFQEIPCPTFTMTASWSFASFGGYLSSWSAVDRYRKARSADPVPPFLAEVARLWGDPLRVRTVSWPLALRAARLPG